MSAALLRQMRHALGIAQAGLAFVMLVWQPIATKRAVARATLAEEQTFASPPVLADPAAAITSGAARARLTVRSIDRHGAGTRVVIEDADFSRTLDWLAGLDRDGLQVSAIALGRRAQPGHVSVDVTLEGSS